MARYGKKAQQKVKKAMHERKHGTLKRTGSKFPWGPDDPPSQESLHAKFDECMASGAKPLSAASRQLLMQRVEGIESVTDMSQFFAGIL